MSTVTVYKGNHEVSHNTIHQEFHIVEAPDGELFWHQIENANRPGVIKVWLQVAGSISRLPFVLPDWQLIIDNVWMEKKFYQDIEDFIDLKGKVIELRFAEYRFLF